MKKVALLLFASLMAHGASEPAPSPAYIVSRLDKVLFTSIAAAGQTPVAVGDRGVIVRIEQQQPVQQISPVSSMLTQVRFISDKVGFAVGHNATILKTEDGGKRWRIVYRDVKGQRPLLAVHFITAEQGFAIGAYGLFLRSEDGGESWQAELHDGFVNADDRAYLQEIRQDSEADYRSELAAILPHLYAMADDGRGHLLIAGEMGLVARSDDAGRHWRRLNTGYQGTFFTAATTGAGSWLVGGLRGHVFRTDDDGQRWQAIPVPAGISVNGLDVQRDGSVVLTNNNGDVYISQDGYLFTRKEDHLAQVSMAALNSEAGLWVATDEGLKLLPKEHP